MAKCEPAIGVSPRGLTGVRGSAGLPHTYLRARVGVIMGISDRFVWSFHVKPALMQP